MDRLAWIRDLVNTEQQMEEAGVVQVSSGFQPEKHLLNETLLFMTQLKREFVDASTAFNQLKGSPMGRIKIYSISQTQADFMLFRNGFKLVFSIKQPGTVAMGFLQSASLNPGKGGSRPQEEELLKAKWGPFGDLLWSYNDQPIKIEYLVKYYITRFVHESAK